jgi:hypothetical protein
MIRSHSEKPQRDLEIDLTGPQGNAFFLIHTARKLYRSMGYSEYEVRCLADEMRLTTYEGLLHVFDREFGSFITLWR